MGFAFLEVEGIRDANCKVKDSREWFLGHADICTGIVYPSTLKKGEPRDPAVLSLCQEVGKSLSLIADFKDDSELQALCGLAG